VIGRQFATLIPTRVGNFKPPQMGKIKPPLTHRFVRKLNGVSYCSILNGEYLRTLTIEYGYEPEPERLPHLGK
jgi:hypothetical protein